MPRFISLSFIALSRLAPSSSFTVVATLHSRHAFVLGVNTDSDTPDTSSIYSIIIVVNALNVFLQDLDVVCSRGLLSWFALVVCSRGLLSWFALVVCSPGLLSWFALLVTLLLGQAMYRFVSVCLDEPL
jgi:hypothetical protein